MKNFFHGRIDCFYEMNMWYMNLVFTNNSKFSIKKKVILQKKVDEEKRKLKSTL